MYHEIQIELRRPSPRGLAGSRLFARPFLLPALALMLMGLGTLPTIHAVTPPPDGGYPDDNAAEGTDALFSLTSGFEDSAIGTNALYHNTSGYLNAGIGAYALVTNSTGIENTAVGAEAMFENTTGDCNTAVGWLALGFNSTGSGNTALGAGALGGNSSGSNNIAIGNSAGSSLTGDNNVALANFGGRGESGVMRFGTEGTHTATYIAGIRTSPLAVAVGVGITSSGQLGIRASSARFKEQIKPMESASQAILALKPVTFRYRHDLDPSGLPQFGLVAEQVARVSPDLVVRDDEGKPLTVRYEAIDAMLLNEFLKEHQTVQSQAETIANLKSALAEQGRAIQALTATVQKVSARVEAAQPAPMLTEAR